MKLKYFLRGLGTGIIFSTVILVISINISSSRAQKTMTREEIIEAAKEYGLVDPLDEALDNLKATSTPSASPEIKESESPTQNPTIEPTTEPTLEPTTEPTVEPTTEPTIKPTETPIEETSDNEIEEISIIIKSGMYSSQVAKMLEENGLVDNAHEFDRFLIKNGYQSKLVVGVHAISKGSDFEAIAKKISR